LVIAPTIDIVAGTITIVVLAVLAAKIRALDVSGAIAGALISFATLLAGGLGWLAVIVAFVLISSVLTKYSYEYKQKLGSAQEKGGRRSWPNALANGLIGGVAAILELITHQEIYAVLYVASIAAAMSDTIATEIGLLSNSRPRMIINPRKIAVPGTSGAISGLGEIAGLASAIGIAGLGALLNVDSGSHFHAAYAFIAVAFSAFLAMNFDSLLGATVQGKNRCKVCGKSTESLRHHGEPTISENGTRFLDNNMVNLIATFVAALISVAVYLALVS